MTTETRSARPPPVAAQREEGPPRKRVRTLASGLEGKSLRGEDLQLTPAEADLFATIKEVVKRFELTTQVRVAGGWVRDKLLGRSSHDIDLALDDMTGLAFAEKVNAYLEEKGHEVHRIGLIQANPDQSKHLETASVNILGQSIDLVNLRAEEYVQESRIPSMTFGTAREDAERRDFTINALFYNINEDIVEDLTKRGLHDLECGIIRTPLPADTTFHDDPLRMLRAIRFGSRYDFSLDDAIVVALRDQTNVRALQDKVSRERIGIELRTMLESSRPVNALQLLCTHGLCPVVFMPPDFIAPNPATEAPLDEASLASDTRLREHLAKLDWQERVDFAKRTVDVLRGETAAGAACALVDYPRDEKNSPYAMEDFALGCLSALFYDLGDLEGLGSPKRKLEPAMQLVVRDTVKMRASIALDVALVSSTALGLGETARELASKAPERAALVADEDARIAVGRLYVRGKQLMPIALALASALAPDHVETLRMMHSVATNEWMLREMWQDKPLLDGKVLMRELGIKKGGTHIGILMDRQLEWRIRHRGDPSATRDACATYLKSIMGPIVEAEEAKKAARLHAVAEEKRIRRERHEEEQRKARERKAKKLQAAREAMSREDKPQHRLPKAD
ncbi:CCA tRNA nucleotidyltransferase, mitochondrial [Hondaea fermentalgiana]|uniref:CCA tRNA nucleotidyltransferase, mitochondrial n=1 Tax=Hondaea fermentalgiana TaxID=2315210 RepID=A0A2R5GJI3_9STRA|nr:CCA tRNA nucleotidyltransferase, mitochondrial [Hondaea fermentalgiana]|eukprot:GBG29898.1 CCA tRNA nucleotidyltransferase, mitochondrial [Hondaea fermentalgiana]